VSLSLSRLSELLIYEIPRDHLVERVHIVRSPILVFEIVRLFPYVDSLGFHQARGVVPFSRAYLHTPQTNDPGFSLAYTAVGSSSSL
jgi:hypothetical protein